MIELTQDNLEHLAISFGTLGLITTEKAIIFNLALDQRMYTPREAQKIFDIALEQGFIIELPDGKYKSNFDNAGQVIDKELVEKASINRLYEEQTQAHEDHILKEEALTQEYEGINAMINSDAFRGIEQAYNDCRRD